MFALFLGSAFAFEFCLAWNFAGAVGLALRRHSVIRQGTNYEEGPDRLLSLEMSSRVNLIKRPSNKLRPHPKFRETPSNLLRE